MPRQIPDPGVQGDLLDFSELGHPDGAQCQGIREIATLELCPMTDVELKKLQGRLLWVCLSSVERQS